MIIKDLFLKPIDRYIDGVIKADDNRRLLTEIEEYVITAEAHKALGNVLDHYLNNPVVNGAWISGFFGSGKSHLLKMLALLLENREIDGQHTLDLFLAKVTEDQFFRANLEKAGRIPSKSILFNIAQKANKMSKDHSDTLLGTFVKVFDEMCGYYGNLGYIAQFERDLDNQGLLVQFKEAYTDLTSKKWEDDRVTPHFKKRNIGKAYGIVTKTPEEDAVKILDRYREDYSMSIEDFALLVNDYIEKQEKGFRLNFFVDEVGQYIADDIRLMTDLQTIAESLATKTEGRAWIFVTSQQNMESILGEMSRLEGHDFSKIQGRFKAKVSLSSANVDEVIKLRLLAKNDAGKDALEPVFLAHENNFKTLFDFPDGAKKYRGYENRKQFISTYPFAPYQFTLFQSSIQNLSKHDAFTGQYQSVGERSMLEVFQEVVKAISAKGIGSVAPFNLMFESVRNVIKSTVIQGITQAENQLGNNTFAVDVLKALFLVKYVKEFQTTPRNITVLLIEEYDQDIQALKSRVEEALAKLEQQTYIKRSDNIYEYLTDKERDIETEIKNTDLDIEAITSKMSKIFFEVALAQNKFRYERNDQDFSFTKKVDGQSYGKIYELGIHIRTDNEAAENMRAMSINEDDLIVSIPEDDDFYREIQMFLKTKMFVMQNSSRSRSNEETLLIQEKGRQNSERFEWIKRRAIELLGRADMFVFGDDVSTNQTDAKGRIAFGFQRLIESRYPNLEMLKSKRYHQNEFAAYIENGRQSQGDLFEELPGAEADIMATINRNIAQGVSTSVYNLLNVYEQKPYGWSYDAVICLIGKLYGLGKVEISLDSKPVDQATLVQSIKKSTLQSRIILRPAPTISMQQVNRLKQVYSDTFHKPANISDAKSLGELFESAVRDKLEQLEIRFQDQAIYPFLSQLEPAIELLRSIRGKTYDWYYDNLEAFEDDLPEIMEGTVNSILTFMAGSQKQIYQDARNYLDLNSFNVQQIAAENGEELTDLLADPSCFRGNKMNRVKMLHESIKGRVDRRLKNIVEAKKKEISELKNKLELLPEFKILTDEKRSSINAKFLEIEVSLSNTTNIAELSEKFNIFRLTDYPSIMDDVLATGSEGAESERQTTKQIINIRIQHSKGLLSSPNDVDEYIEQVRKALLAELEKGHNIIV